VILRDRLAATGKSFYCVTFSIRSGSSLLCEDLTQWGLGAPTEYFQLPTAPVLEVGELADYVVKVVEETPGDVFGVKMSWQQTYALGDHLHKEGETSAEFDLRSVFPGLRYVHISRKDKIAQAVSGWRSLQTGVWHHPVGETVVPGQPPYDFERIKAVLLQCIAEDWLWRSFFEDRSIDALDLVYEEYVQDRVAGLGEIARFLDQEPALVAPTDRLNVLQDEWSAGIIDRARADLFSPPSPNWTQSLFHAL
jgi:LPS sulfotransferase NodH